MVSAPKERRVLREKARKKTSSTEPISAKKNSCRSCDNRIRYVWIAGGKERVRVREREWAGFDILNKLGLKRNWGHGKEGVAVVLSYKEYIRLRELTIRPFFKLFFCLGAATSSQFLVSLCIWGKCFYKIPSHAGPYSYYLTHENKKHIKWLLNFIYHPLNFLKLHWLFL